jgi:biotin carboxyl carrier protein
MNYDVFINGVRHNSEFTPAVDKSSRVVISIDDRNVCADAVKISRDAYSILMDGRSIEIRVEPANDGLLLHSSNREFRVAIVDPRSWRQGRAGKIELAGRQKLLASMPGKIVRVLVEVGQQVEVGQGLLVVEAMKMQNEIRSSKSGTVERLAQQGQTVSAGEVIAIVI